MAKTIYIIASIVVVLMLIIGGFFLFRQDGQQNSSTGASGKVQFGRGDCIPCACNGEDCSGCPERRYSPYNGDMLILKKSIVDSLTGSEDTTELISLGKRVSVEEGNYEISLDSGEYVVNLLRNSGTYSFSHNYAPYDDRLLTISEGDVTEKDFTFFECTSY